MIHLDTSALIDAFSGSKRLSPRLRQFLEDGERIFLSAPVLFEWRRGPRIPQEIEAQEALFPSSESIPFGAAEAFAAARIYRAVRRPRGRETDIAIAACAIVHRAHLWTLNRTDYEDIPDLLLL
jgi:predicted nucleic acid-binding protein